MEDKKIYLKSQVIWSMIDANGHLRHSAYADFAAQSRINVVADLGMANLLMKEGIGPILFREELVYLKEIRLSETIKVAVELTKVRADGSRYSMRSTLYNSDNVVAAIINVDGAWLDLKKRKLTGLPDEIQQAFLHIPQAEDFILEPVPEKNLND